MGKLDEPNLVRIRNNQRRSRARHKEYVAGLEERVRHCELKRIEANFEIQQAARKVADENKKIRKLLNTLGFDDEKITCFLKTGNLDANDATPPKSLHDQENMNQTMDLLLQQSHLSMSDYNTFTNNSYPSSELNSIHGSQEQSSAHATGADKHIQLHNSDAMNDISLALETQGHPLYSVSPSYPPAGPLQHPIGSIDPPGCSQSLESAQHIMDIGRQDSVYSRQEAGCEPTINSYSSLPSILRDSSYPMSLENMFQNSQGQNYTYSDYYSTRNCINDMADAASNLLFSLDMTDYLT
ncbi:uncharacterized protein F4807DRAFT_460199 [Annulohypoxylon truncatum]|uniref:uncharacterized protein n=1 Tax=Annulohypoxylon truncatum TaxID=327061 RepID=UPI002007DDD1|nr:uncharacterized protein F4807DRAFT_460199 [Annulohypoxylon truncatum]KAI1209906.1 hypothetical protein F4807DRAFT_460199 [Annulohypoxylon truncatum]